MRVDEGYETTTYRKLSYFRLRVLDILKGWVATVQEASVLPYMNESSKQFEASKG